MIRMFFSKRGQLEEELGSKPIFWVGAAVFVLLGMIFALILLFGKFKSSDISSPDELYESTYINRFLSSPSCFAFEDPLTGRAYPGLIDMGKFTEENLRRCMAVSDKSPIKGFLLELEGKSIETQDFGTLSKKLVVPVFIKTSDGQQAAKLLVGIGK